MATTMTKPAKTKHRSAEITHDPQRAPARAMLMAMGITHEDMEKPFVAIANLASDVTPCNVHLGRFAQAAKEGVRAGKGVPFEFGTITVSDGISMGTEGMKTSLVSREVIADSIELVTFGERMDGLITIAGCDKNMPGCLMALARLKRTRHIHVRRLDNARPAQRQGCEHPGRVRGCGRLRQGRHHLR